MDGIPCVSNPELDKAEYSGKHMGFGDRKQRQRSILPFPTYVPGEGVFSGFFIQFFICKEMILHSSFPPLWNRHNVTYVAGLFLGFQIGINDNNAI